MFPRGEFSCRVGRVVVSVSKWLTECSVRRTVYGHGEIRLEDGEGEERVSGDSLSVKAEGEEGEVLVEDEKVSD